MFKKLFISLTSHSSFLLWYTVIVMASLYLLLRKLLEVNPLQEKYTNKMHGVQLKLKQIMLIEVKLSTINVNFLTMTI